MRKLCFTAAAVSTVVCASPALAQDAPAIGGAFAGVIIGYDEVTLDDGVDSGSEGDVMYGFTAGYDVGVSESAFVGIEIEAAESQVGVSVSDVLVPGDSFALNAGRDLYVGARVGFQIGGSTQLYVKGGYTYARISAEYDDGTAIITDAENLDGIRLGGGVEVGMGPVAVRAEYRYSMYGELLGSDVDLSRHQVVAGAVGRF